MKQKAAVESVQRERMADRPVPVPNVRPTRLPISVDNEEVESEGSEKDAIPANVVKAEASVCDDSDSNSDSEDSIEEEVKGVSSIRWGSLCTSI
jgi:hypothetical protein